MNYFFFGPHADPGNKDQKSASEPIDTDADPNFDESFSQGGEYLDDSLRMVEQPFEDGPDE